MMIADLNRSRFENNQAKGRFEAYQRFEKNVPSFKGANNAFNIARKEIKQTAKEYGVVAQWLAKPMVKIMDTRASHYLSEKIGKMEDSISHLSALVAVMISSFYVYGASTNKNIPDERRGYLITNSILGGVSGVGLSYLIDYLFKKPLKETENARANMLKPLMPQDGQKIDPELDLADFAKKFGIKTSELLKYMGFDVQNCPEDSLKVKDVIEKMGEGAHGHLISGAKRFRDAQKDGARKFKSLMIFTPIVRFLAPLAAIPLAAVIYNKVKPLEEKSSSPVALARFSMNDCVTLASKNHKNVNV